MNRAFQSHRWHHAIRWNIVAGLWLILSPFLLGYDRVEIPMWDHLAAGFTVSLLALIRMAGLDREVTSSWLSVLLGIWLIVSPFLLTFGPQPAAVWNSILSGITISCLSLTSISLPRLHPHHGNRM